MTVSTVSWKSYIKYHYKYGKFWMPLFFVNILTEFNSEGVELLQRKPIVKYLEIGVRFKNCNISFLI